MYKPDKLFFEIHSWVVHVASGWTAQASEDLTDDLELEIHRAVDANAANQAQWVSLQQDGRSTVTLEVLSGAGWLHQVIPVYCVVTRGTSRKAVRQALAAHLTSMVPAAQTVYAYQPAYFGAASPASEVESPVVYVASAASERAV